MKPLLFWHENDDRRSHEESKKVNKDEDVDNTASGGGAKVDVKTTLRKNGDSNESQPHRGEWDMYDFTRDSIKVTMVIPIFQTRVGQKAGLRHELKALLQSSVVLYTKFYAT